MNEEVEKPVRRRGCSECGEGRGFKRGELCGRCEETESRLNQHVDFYRILTVEAGIGAR